MENKNQKHTPGPWKVIPSSRRGTFEFKNDDLVSTDETLANCRLMSTAPDMHSMLNQCLDMLHELDSSDSEINISKQNLEDQIAGLLLTIAGKK